MIRVVTSISRYQMKCTQYWPEIRKVSRYGNITIRTVEEKQYAFYVIRKLKVANKEVIVVGRTKSKQYLIC